MADANLQMSSGRVGYNTDRGFLPAVALLDTAGNTGPAQVGNNSDAEAASATANNQRNVAFNYVFNGTTWSRARGDTIGASVVLVPRATATEGNLIFRRIATADTNAAVIKAGAGRLYAYEAINLTAAWKFVKLYNKATAPVVGTDVPLMTIGIPPNGAADLSRIHGLQGFAAGIAIAITNGVADTDATAVAAGDVVFMAFYN